MRLRFHLLMNKFVENSINAQSTILVRYGWWDVMYFGFGLSQPRLQVHHTPHTKPYREPVKKKRAGFKV